MSSWIVSKTEAGERLDVGLSDHCGLSRSLIQRWVKARNVTINRKVLTSHERLKEGDLVEWQEEEEKEREPEIKKDFVLLYEDDDVFVVEKPAGVLVHKPSVACREWTVADWAVQQVPEMKDVGEHGLRPGVVHRLDRDASGVLILAKTSVAHAFLKRQFSGRLVRKEYLVLAYGRFSKEEGTIRFAVGRSDRKGRMTARPEGSEGKEAVTHFDVLKRFKTATFVRARIETGRTHQIRVHFRAIGHPVVGDTLYYRRKTAGIREIPLSRLFLHAERLEITLPSGECRTFISSLPTDLEDLLSRLPTA